MDNESFWNKQGTVNGVKAVNFDENMNTLENKAVEPFIKGCKRVLDLGCGNGETLKYLAKLYPQTKFLGIDSSSEMIKSVCLDNSFKNISFLQGDAININYADSFDAVIGKRLLINILSDEDRIKVIDNIETALKDDGKYIMVENFIEPLGKVNELRKVLGHEIIKVHEFNKYLTEDFIKTVERKDLCMIKEVDFGSLYYFASRIFNAGGSYDSTINKDAVNISLQGYSQIIQKYSPERLIVFEKMKEGMLVGGLDV